MSSWWIRSRPLIAVMFGSYALWIRGAAFAVPPDAVGITAGRFIDAALAGTASAFALLAVLIGGRFPRAATALMLPVVAFLGASVATGLRLLVTASPFATFLRFPGFATAAYIVTPPIGLLVALVGAFLAVISARKR